MTIYSPKQVQTALDASATTLRRWSEQFSAHLSSQATTAPRRYTDRDLATLRRARDLLGAGLTVDQVESQLGQPEPLPAYEAPAPGQPQPGRELAPVDALLAALEAQQATSAQIASTLASLAETGQLQRQVDELDHALDLLRRDHEALARAVDGLRQRVDELEGALGSVGSKMHGHKGIGRALSGYEE